MNIKKRYLTRRERILAIVLGVLCVVLLYLLLIDRPLRERMTLANTQIETLTEQVQTVNEKVAEVEAMRRDLDALGMEEHPYSTMPSYNSGKEELDFLNLTLASTIDYYIGFDQVTREGEQIRRGFSLQFKAASYDEAVQILDQLEQSEIRCLISNFSVTPAENEKSLVTGPVDVSCLATFYETMRGGIPDGELPEDTAPTVEEILEE